MLTVCGTVVSLVSVVVEWLVVLIGLGANEGRLRVVVVVFSGLVVVARGMGIPYGLRWMLVIVLEVAILWLLAVEVWLD